MKALGLAATTAPAQTARAAGYLNLFVSKPSYSGADGAGHSFHAVELQLGFPARRPAR
ncbi:hypothetical protein [Hymenobacter gummosus]|uniref:hypothetical protein n=1 Tax=Hymenobacter gummosus TaxID=1776032 RepID=UPI0014050752|nr:hypothetical protein [Hymenobacter gummosus]